MLDRWLRRWRSDPPEGIDWLLDAYEGLLAHWGADYFKEAPLVLPTDAFYPVSVQDPERAIEQVFQLTLEHAGLSDWPVRRVREQAFSAIAALARIPHEGATGAVSTGLRFDASTDPPTALVTYVDDDLRSPDAFVYHCVAQLAALGLSTVQTVPGGNTAFWRYVDVCACFMGFGVFACNASFIFEGFSEGLMEGYWYQHRGNLTTEVLASALALFVLLRGLPPGLAPRHLSANARVAYNKALKYIDKHHGDRLDALGRMQGPDRGALSFPAPSKGSVTLCEP